MPLRMLPAPVATGRPRWLTLGTIKLGVLCAFIVGVGMIRPRLSPDSAGIVLLAGGALVATGAAMLFLTTRRLAAHLPLLDRSQRVADAILLVIRRTGLPLLGLAFFLFWTFVYLGLWWFRPEGPLPAWNRIPALRTSSTTPSRPRSSPRRATSWRSPGEREARQ